MLVKPILVAGILGAALTSPAMAHPRKAATITHIANQLAAAEHAGIIKQGSRLDHIEDRFDRLEDRIDRREDRRDRAINNGPLDRLEDRLDRAENIRDRRENRIDRRL